MKDLGFKNLGFINLAVIYLSLSFSSLFSVRITKALGVKKTLIFSGLTYTFWIACFLFPSYKVEQNLEGGVFHKDFIMGLNIVSGAIIGVGAANIWTA